MGKKGLGVRGYSEPTPIALRLAGRQARRAEKRERQRPNVSLKFPKLERYREWW